MLICVDVELGVLLMEQTGENRWEYLTLRFAW